MSVYLQKCHPSTRNLNSQTPGDSKNAFLHCGHILGRTKPTATMHTAALASALHGFERRTTDWSPSAQLTALEVIMHICFYTWCRVYLQPSNLNSSKRSFVEIVSEPELQFSLSHSHSHSPHGNLSCCHGRLFSCQDVCSPYHQGWSVQSPDPRQHWGPGGQ